jgi:hypothetical protein
MTNDEVQGLIEELKQLNVQQSEVLTRLEKAREKEEKKEVGQTATAQVDQTKEELTHEIRDFAVGQEVRIKNPNFLQTDRGTITKIGQSRITVQTKSGSKIQRAPKNIAHLKGAIR